MWQSCRPTKSNALLACLKRGIAEIFAKEKPTTMFWAMGQTRLSTGTGNVGYRQRRCKHLSRPHVQGATDLGVDVTTPPLYYGLAEDAWRYWCRVWEVDYDWMKSRFPSMTLMEAPSIPSTRWFDATLLQKDQVSQPDNVQAMFVLVEWNLPGSNAHHQRSVCQFKEI
jgi:formate dehydrogenase major subunit